MKKARGYIYIVIGILLIFIAAYIVRENLNESAEAGSASDENLVKVIEQMPDRVLPADFSGPMPVVDVEGRSFIGTVQIPSLGLLLPIQDEWSSDNAKVSVCRYKGSAYDNDLIVCGHNYVEHFGTLPDLTTGEWDFTMFTCTVGGSNRVTVRCEATGEVSETGTEPDVIKAAEESKHIRKQN